MRTHHLAYRRQAFWFAAVEADWPDAARVHHGRAAFPASAVSTALSGGFTGRRAASIQLPDFDELAAHMHVQCGE